MILFLFISFIPLIKAAFPKFSFIAVDEEMTQNDYDEINKQFSQAMTYIKGLCDKFENKNEKNNCKEYVDSFLEIICSNGNDISKKLSQVSKKADSLFYIGTSIDNVIDFNNLKSQMTVLIINPSKINTGSISQRYSNLLKEYMEKMVKQSYDGSEKSMIRFSKSIKKTNNKKIKESTSVEMVGKINSKVSFLTMVNCYVKIVNSDLNCHSVYMHGCTISSSSQIIRANTLLVDESTHNHLTEYEGEKLKNKIKVNQYGLVIVESNNMPDCRLSISYVGDSISVNQDQLYDGKIPYISADTIGIIAFTSDVYIGVGFFSLPKYNQLNLTITYNEPLKNLPFLESDDEKFAVTIKTDENWNRIENKPNVIITTDKSEFQINEPDGSLKYKVESQYVYKPKKNGPNIGMIIGIVVGCVVFVAIVVVVVIIVIRKKRKNAEESSNEGNEIA